MGTLLGPKPVFGRPLDKKNKKISFGSCMLFKVAALTPFLGIFRNRGLGHNQSCLIAHFGLGIDCPLLVKKLKIS